MHRMRHFIAMSGIFTLALLAVQGNSSASLLKPNAGRAYPDIAADINGTVKYTYNATSQLGTFTVQNTPYLLAAGATSAQEYSILPNSDTGVRSQSLQVTLDTNGQFVASSDNLYKLWGTIVANGETYSGLLLQGVPTSFGSQDLGALGIQGSDIFDVTLKITGGALSSFFGADAYMRISPELNSTFTGQFDVDFSADKATSNTRTYNSPQPFPVPEPGTLTVLLLGMGGMALRNKKRLRHPAR